MITSIRQQYNSAFSAELYQSYLDDLNSKHPGAIEFRVAETPVFIDSVLKEKILAACEAIVDVITQPDFKKLTDSAVPEALRVPNENEHTHFIAFDFGICTNENGELEPQLI